ncbi:MAG: hypothetical protein ACI9A7_002245, partial [Cyclobacteriaceae bacterium]
LGIEVKCKTKSSSFLWVALYPNLLSHGLKKHATRIQSKGITSGFKFFAFEDIESKYFINIFRKNARFCVYNKK